MTQLTFSQRKVSHENLMSRRTLTFSEIFLKTKSLIQELRGRLLRLTPGIIGRPCRVPLPSRRDRVVQTTISRLASGHIRGLSFNLRPENLYAELYSNAILDSR
ncbi:hypothetical protein TNCV_4276981 [Trichonephila clavipes]|nr:hypothetical protein TNCV_4276981 [Trichonephila clavipes]